MSLAETNEGGETMADSAAHVSGGYADLFITALCWSFMGLFTRSNTCSALLTAAVSSLSALVFLLVVVRPTPRFTWRVALVGLASCATSITFIFANKLTTVGNAIVLQYSSTVFVIAYESIAHRRLPRLAKVGVVAMALVGMVLFFFDELTVEGMVGNALSIASGAFFGLTFFLNASPEALPLPSSLMGFALTSLALLAVLPELPDVSAVNWGLMIAQGVVCSGIASVFYARGVRHVPALTSNMICMCEVILAPLWAFLAFGESFGRFALVGAVLIVTSIVANLILDARPPRASKVGSGQDLPGGGRKSVC